MSCSFGHECPTFTPNMEEFCNFAKYVNKIEQEVGKIGLCKVSCNVEKG